MTWRGRRSSAESARIRSGGRRLTRRRGRGREYGMTPGFELVAFDLYGTLLDVRGLAGALEKHLGPGAAEILGKWRTAQLEQTWELNRNARYQPWDRVTANALAHVAPSVPADA